MSYSDLNRKFDSLKSEQDINSDIYMYWGDDWGSWLEWKSLLEMKRVVVLAEAASGKTTEFKIITAKLKKEGKSAFFVTIEDLADDGLINSLDPEDITQFQKWESGLEEGYFFLDSIDEARLNKKRFDKALRRFASELTESLDKIKIYISCRFSDWKGKEDEDTINRLLPHQNRQAIYQKLEPENVLLEPLFDRNKSTTNSEPENQKEKTELFVARLLPLDSGMQKRLAEHIGITDHKAFSNAIWQNGLENLSERPGDLIELGEYWKSYGRFGSLYKMTAHAIENKLSELDPYRIDGESLSVDRAKEGAKKIAAALTFGKTFTIGVPAHHTDFDMKSESLDSRKLLKKWNDAERTTLLRKGIFAPSTYGRVRFHHRSTQEYLTAKWLLHLVEKGCPISKIFKILFAEVYGVKTVVPSLRATAAWISHDKSEVMEEVVNREPLLLIQHGDPGSLPITIRQKLLKTYAEMYNSGNITNDSLDLRALWMFAHDDLQETIHEVWRKCKRYNFRGDILRLIREGRLCDCVDIAEEVIQNSKSEFYHKILAIEVLKKCKCKRALLNFSKDFMQQYKQLITKHVAQIASKLFPEFLDIDQLLFLIEKTKPIKNRSTEGFGYLLDSFWKNCPEKWKSKFALRLATLSLSKPFVADYERISKRYRYIPECIEPIVRDLIEREGIRAPSKELIMSLMALERTREIHLRNKKKEPTTFDLVQANLKLKRDLFWADVEETRKNRGDKRPIRSAGQIFFMNRQLWELDKGDLVWLYNDLKRKKFIDNRRIALSAILRITYSGDKFKEDLGKIKKIVKGEIVLEEDITNFLRPIEESPLEIEHRLRSKKYKKDQAEQERKNKESWIKFQKRVIAKPEYLIRPKSRLTYIHNITIWLKKHTKLRMAEMAKHWKLVETAFSIKVAEYYRDGLKSLWRDVEPRRPIRKNGGTTTKWENLYAYLGVCVEATDDNWVNNLTDAEKVLAAKHACLTEQGYPAWLDELTHDSPELIIPIVENQVRYEFKKNDNVSLSFIRRFGDSELSLHPKLADRLFEIISRSKRQDANTLGYKIDILFRIDMSNKQEKRIKRFALKFFDNFIETGKIKRSLQFLSLLFMLSPEVAYGKIKSWVESGDPNQQKEIMVSILSGLFYPDRRNAFSQIIKKIPINTLKNLILYAYKYLHPSNDILHEGVYTPSARDNAANGRSALLKELASRSGKEAYDAIVDLSSMKVIGKSSLRFRQISREMAERDSELFPWTEDNINEFEQKNLTPILGGYDLYHLALNILDDISFSLRNSDASSLRLLRALSNIQSDDEESVQGWLAEQFILRSDSRYHTHRESEISDSNKPDIILSGTNALVEVAIEVKQADSYSPNELKDALETQLAKKYLKPNTRKHGVLVLTDHGRRKWKHPVTKKRLTFEQLLVLLTDIGNKINTDPNTDFRISVYGIDAKE